MNVYDLGKHLDLMKTSCINTKVLWNKIMKSIEILIFKSFCVVVNV